MTTKTLDDPYHFSHLSYEAERLGVSQRTVSKMVDDILETFSHPLPMNLHSNALVGLLGMIHSLGCYSLPLTYNEGTSQKPLGAFYTPPQVADYIVSLTLSPTLDQLASNASSDGLAPLEEILSRRTLDPACGTGVFLVSAMKVYADAMRKGIQNALDSGTSRHTLKQAGVIDFLEIIRSNMFGVDIDSGALEVTDVSLRLLSMSSDNELHTSSLGRSLKRGNSLISLKGLNGAADHRHFFADASSRSPFEWHDEFRSILDSGGFDFVLMNPPYERLKPNLAEFLRERLLTGEREIHMENFSKHKERLSEDVEYFRKSGEYQIGNRYSIDTHRLFIERTLQLTSDGSKIGFIVPSTILGDISAQPLRTSIILENQLLTVDDFPESSRLFEGVTQSVSVLTLQRGKKTKSFLARFGLNDIDDAISRNHIRIPADKIEKVVGSSLSIPQVNKVGWNLISKLHQQPSISSLDWIDVKRGELDLTLNRDCITSETTDFSLIRGSNITRYSLIERNSGKSEFVDIDRLRKKLGRSGRAEHIDMPRLACQQVSNRTQRWRLKFASIPSGVVLANSCNYVVLPTRSGKSHHLSLLGLLNSELLNWRFSLTNTNNHVSTRELTQLPIADSTESELRSKMVREVGRVKRNVVSPMIEAITFALYGFSVKDAKTVLDMRSTPKNETESIAEDLQSLISWS
jgi:Alw26I/Eco31I/Esp3I family type II restriction m6 adenine DNA methyltransferase